MVMEEALLVSPAMTSVPPFTVTLPLSVLVPVRVKVPALTVKLPLLPVVFVIAWLMVVLPV